MTNFDQNRICPHPECLAETIISKNAIWTTLIKTIPFCVALVDSKGVVLEASPAFYSMLGYTQEEFSGKTYVDVTHPEDLTKDWNQHQRLIKGEIETYSLKKRYLHKDGRIIYAFLEVGIVKGTDLCIAYVNDITSQEESELDKVVDTEVIEAIFNDQFFLQYQPVVNLSDRSIVGYEGLVRWDSNHGRLYPGAFLHRLSASTQLLLTLEIAKMACVKLKSLKLRGQEDLWLAINLSPYDIKSKGFLSRFNAVIESHSVDRGRIRLEITEEDMLESPWMIQILEALKIQGHKIELDDFGTGYSSLGSISTYPISVIKVDKSLIDGIPGDKNKEKVFRLILTMADALRHEVIAEGIETEDQAKWLEFNGCVFGQGYLLGKPEDI